jgi:hypothetical protein
MGAFLSLLPSPVVFCTLSLLILPLDVFFFFNYVSYNFVYYFFFLSIFSRFAVLPCHVFECIELE